MNVSVVKIFFVIVFNLVGVGLLMVSQNASTIVTSLARGKAVLASNSKAAETFQNPPVPTHVKFYFFNVTNEEAVLEGNKPVVKECGPYVFRMESNKSMQWTETKVTYESTKWYFFEETLSQGGLDDVVVTLDPAAMTAARFGDPPFLFTTASIREFLFDGISREDADSSPGYFAEQNGTSEGPYEAFTGEGNIEDLNRLTKYAERIFPESPMGLECEHLQGTNGERFPPFTVPPTKVTLYNPKLGRPWDLHYNGTVEVNGLDCVRYANGRDFFSRTLNRTLDECLEQNSNDFDKGIQGVFMSQDFQATSSPILFTLPHFLNADSRLLEDVEGLEPSEAKHAFYLDVFPALGFVLDMRIRVQVNFRLHPYGEPKNEKIKEIILPVFWQEMMLLKENSDEAASIVYSNVKRPEKAMYWIALTLGALLILAGEILLLSGMCSKDSSDDYEEDAYVTYSSKNGRSQVNVR